jgi:hypothetical protein
MCRCVDAQQPNPSSIPMQCNATRSDLSCSIGLTAYIPFDRNVQICHVAQNKVDQLLQLVLAQEQLQLLLMDELVVVVSNEAILGESIVELLRICIASRVGWQLVSLIRRELFTMTVVVVAAAAAAKSSSFYGMRHTVGTKLAACLVQVRTANNAHNSLLAKLLQCS